MPKVSRTDRGTGEVAREARKLTMYGRWIFWTIEQGKGQQDSQDHISHERSVN